MRLSRRQFLMQSAAATAAGLAAPLWLPGPAGAEAVATAGSEPRVIGAGTVGPDIHRGATPAAIPPGLFQPDSDSIRRHYKPPQWFSDARFGIFIHWGLYAVPAYHNEWYARHMYGAFAQYQTDHYGPPDKFGYKDFIPLFKAERFDPDAWATLFKKSGARYVVPCGEHHDGFALWDSSLTRWCAGKMGPKRDLIGDLSKAIKKQGLVFGVSSHRMEHHSFMYPTTKVKTDLFDPAYADFYGPPIQEQMDAGGASPAFQDDWLARCQELIDKYQPQMLWFDAGVDAPEYRAVLLRCAAFYYNRAAGWGKEVSLSTKDSRLAGSILDFEKGGRGPKDILGGAWQIDDQIATNSWGYINDIKYRSAASILGELIDASSKGGNLLLNISPKADGTIPDEQQQILLTVGKWLETNGEAIYGTRPWTRFADGPFHFTTGSGALYAIGAVGADVPAVIPSLATGASGKVSGVRLLGRPGELKFSQDADGLKVQMPPGAPDRYASVLKITGLKTTGTV